MGIKRIVDVSFWTDGKVDDFSPEDKYFMLYLLTNPFSRQLGIYEISVKQAAFQLGYTVDTVMTLLDRFESKYNMIRFSKETNEVAILNFLRHSVMKGGKPVEDCIIQDISKVKNRSLIDFVFGKLQGRDDLNKTVEKIVNEYINNNDIHNDNDNDNDRTADDSSTNRSETSNEAYYEQIKEDVLNKKGDGDKACDWCGCKTTVLHKHHYPIPKRLGGKDIVNICSNCHHEFHVREGEVFGDNHTDLTTPKKPKKTKSEKPVKHKYGEYKNVLLSDDELEKLKAEYPDYLDRIERLSSYVASTGKSYKSHYATIRNWARKDAEKPGRKEMVPYWMKKNQFNNFPERSAENMDDLETALLGVPKTAANDENLRRRAEELKKRLRGADNESD